MRALWFCLLVHSVLAQTGFGRSYLHNSRLCHQWNCVNSKLGLPDALPAREQYTHVLRSILPQGSWQGVVEDVLDVCYGNRTRRYTNTCPGQALMHCVIDQLIENCPENYLRKEDACSQVTSLAGFKYMFSQSRYENLEANLPTERRPSWFLKNYFDTKCCNLPPLFDSTLMSECGFSTLMQYYTHAPKYDNVALFDNYKNHVGVSTTPPTNGDTLKIVDFNAIPAPEIADPLDCCDMTEFINPSLRQECNFHLSFEGQERLVIKNQTVTTTEVPTTVASVRTRDLVVVPQSCEKENCVFKKLGIVSEDGAVNLEGFMKMLDNFTDSHPMWTKAKARVVTSCLTKPLKEYDADCEINKILACTFDVLTENCPFSNKSSVCKHSRRDVVCQISSSKYRPKNRRDICFLPDLVHFSHLSECGVTSLSRREQAPELVVSKQKKPNWLATKYACKDLTPSTTCLLSKMGIMNKYNFMDYFKMKDRIRQFTTTHPEWTALSEFYISSFINMPMYREHCSSGKKLLNVIDSMVMTCPVPRRKNTPQCAKIFSEMATTSPLHTNYNMTPEKVNQIMKHFQHVFVPPKPMTNQMGTFTKPTKRANVIKTPLYDFGLLDSKNAPKVSIIDVKPKPVAKKPLMLVPVYMRMPIRGPILRLYKPINNNGQSMTTPFWLHNQIAQAHASITPPISTTSPISTNPISTKPITNNPISTNNLFTETNIRDILDMKAE